MNLPDDVLALKQIFAEEVYFGFDLLTLKRFEFYSTFCFLTEDTIKSRNLALKMQNKKGDIEAEENVKNDLKGGKMQLVQEK